MSNLSYEDFNWLLIKQIETKCQSYLIKRV